MYFIELYNLPRCDLEAEGEGLGPSDLSCGSTDVSRLDWIINLLIDEEQDEIFPSNKDEENVLRKKLLSLRLLKVLTEGSVLKCAYGYSNYEVDVLREAIDERILMIG